MDISANSAIRKRILILEISSTGHHPIYTRWLLESELARSSDVILAARRQMFEHPEILACQSGFHRHEIEVGQELKARLDDFSAVGLVRISWVIGRLYREIYASLARIQPIDLVIIPFLDDCILGLALSREAFGGTLWMTITMRTMFHYGEMDILARPQRFTAARRFLFYRMLKQTSMVCVLTIDPTLAEFAERRTDRVWRKIAYLPDPARYHSVLPSKLEARSLLKIPADVQLVVLFGDISARKGALSLLEAAADPSCSPQIHVMLAGRWREPAELLENPAFGHLKEAGRLHTIDRYLLDEEERLVLSAANCMWLGYTDFYGMSGVMVLSGRHGVPVLASREGLIGHLAEKHQIGVIIEPRNKLSVISALNRLAIGDDFFRQAGNRGRSVFERHDPAELQRLVTEKSVQWRVR